VNRHRFAVAGLAVLTVAALSVAACSTPKPGGPAPAATQPSPTPPPPKDALLASVKALSQTSSDLTLRQGTASGTAKVDPATKSATLTMTQVVSGTTIKVDLISIAPDVWLKIDLGAAGNRQIGIKSTKWMKIDKSKVTSDSAFPIDLTGDNDVLDMPDLLAGLVDVQRADLVHYSGTIDQTKAGGVSALSEEDTKKLGDKATSIPFTAVLDNQGRLTNVKIDTSAADPTLTTELTVNSYGSPVTIAKPADSDVVTTPPSLYALLNS
jgi:hypothetical protein